jgi:hypothetical protein
MPSEQEKTAAPPAAAMLSREGRRKAVTDHTGRGQTEALVSCPASAERSEAGSK